MRFTHFGSMLVATATAAFMWGCSDSGQSMMPNYDGDGEVMVKLMAAPNTPFARLADHATLTITASDMLTMTRALVVTDSSVEGTVTGIPAGRSRLFTVMVYDSVDTVQYEGSGTANVIASSTVNVPITVVRRNGGAIINGSVDEGTGSGILFVKSTLGSTASSVYRVNSDGGNPTLVKSDGKSMRQPRWSLDRSKILYVSDSSTTSKLEVFVMASDGSNSRQITSDSPVWGSSWPFYHGSKIWYCSAPATGVTEVYEIDENGANKVKLSNLQAQGRQADRCSVFGSKVYYYSQNASSSPTGEVYSSNLDFTGETRLTINSALDGWPTISPDGTKILFSRSEGGSGYNAPFNMYAMASDGTSQTKLTSATGTQQCVYPVWSPNGLKFAYASYDGSQWDIFVADADGTGAVNITNTPTFDELPSDWQ